MTKDEALERFVRDLAERPCRITYGGKPSGYTSLGRKRFVRECHKRPRS